MSRRKPRTGCERDARPVGAGWRCGPWPAHSLTYPPSPQVSERLSQPGVAIGLAWTPLGGEIMFVEASRMDGEGQLTLTGQLGDVMKESAHLAISWLRSNAKKYHLTNGERRVGAGTPSRACRGSGVVMSRRRGWAARERLTQQQCGLCRPPPRGAAPRVGRPRTHRR